MVIINLQVIQREQNIQHLYYSDKSYQNQFPMKVIYVSAWSRTKSIVTSLLLTGFLHVLNFPLQDVVYSFLRVTINSNLVIVLEAENCSHTLEI